MKQFKKYKINLKTLRFIFSIFILLTIPNQSKASQESNVFINKEYSNQKYILSKNEYILGPGDILNLNLYSAQEYSGDYSILSDGSISLPLLGTTFINNMTLTQATELIYSKYKKQLLQPQLFLILKKARPIKVSVVGEIERPGLYSLTNEETNQTLGNPTIKISGLPTLIDAIQKAGGITSNTNLKNIQLIRRLPGEKASYKESSLDLLSLIQTGDQNQNQFLFDGDIIRLSKVKGNNADVIELAKANLSPKVINVTVIGEVLDPGRKELTANTPLIQAIMQAGGVKDWEADKAKIQLIRMNRNGTVSLKKFKIDLKEGVSEEKNPPLSDGDIIKVNSNSFGKITTGLKNITDPMSRLITAYSLFKLF